MKRIGFVVMALLLTASAGSAQAPPSPEQAAGQLCDMNRVQGEKQAGAIIAQNLKAIADLQAELAKLKKAEPEKK